MPKSSNGELINHFNAVRLRMTGSGEMNLQFQSLSNEIQQELLPLTMNPIASREPTRLANFRQQRAALKMYTQGINEYFKINRLVVFVKPIASGYPG